MLFRSAGWFADAGLDCDLAEEIKLADGASGSLPVMLWRGRDRRVQMDPPLRHKTFEVA